jgi:hypothetical protein
MRGPRQNRSTRPQCPAALAVLAALAAPLPAAAAAPHDQVGTTIFSFMKIGVGARPMGMGGAFTSVADDPHASYWNPAGLALARVPEAATTYMSYFAGVDAGTVAFVQPVGKAGAFGVAGSFLRVGGLQTTTTTNRTGAGLPEFSSRDLSVGAAGAGRLFGDLFAGLGVSFLYEGISAGDGFSATASAFQAGLLYKTGFHGLAFGAAVRNWGNQVSTYQALREDLPLTFAGGASVRPLSRRLVLAADVEKARDNDVGVNAGAELQLVRDFFVRSGYRSLDARVGDDASDGSLAGFTFGVGVRASRRAKIDYAYSSFADLGDVHRVGLAVGFR